MVVKHQIRIGPDTEGLWRRVKIYRVNSAHKDMNQAILALIKLGLDAETEHALKHSASETTHESHG